MRIIHLKFCVCTALISDAYTVHFHVRPRCALNYYICAVCPHTMPALRLKFRACPLSAIAALFKFHAFIADKILIPPPLRALFFARGLSCNMKRLRFSIVFVGLCRLHARDLYSRAS